MLQPGSRLGRYEIRSLLGAGGMGEVYLAHDAQLQRPVALKVLAEAVRDDVELRERLAYEARAASALNHPNILTVYDIGHVGDTHFIATEYVDGITLRQRMTSDGTKLGDVVDVMIQIASALSAAEAAGLVHRDIKPDNIMIRRDGYLKLLDFGLARNGTIAEPHSRRTDPNVIRGTVFYMSPEQLRGTPIDTRSDIWSAGVVMYELITGRLPFEGASSTDIAANILKAEAPPLSLPHGAPVPPRLAAMVECAMSKDRAMRYQTAGELLRDLQQLRLDLEHDAASVVGTPEARLANTEQVSLEGLPPTNLPEELTPLVGRDAERSDVVSLLRRNEIRMVTLTGPGGTGKTRLALAVAANLLPDLGEGAWWVPLDAVRDPRLVVSAIATVLGISEGSAPLLDDIKRALSGQTALLVLDNFEQVQEAAPMLGEILRAASRVKLLVTSRSPLHIAGEREYAVPPLLTPPLDLPLTAEALLHYPSIALFVERATAVKSDFRMTADNARAVAELCVRLDGLPLAIELAAARVKVLPPAAMLTRVEKRLKLLSGGATNLPERQQTMRAAISWGFNLLDPDDQRLFAMLAVFRGGFTIDAAERLCELSCANAKASGVTAQKVPDVVEGISSLLDKAFLRRDPTSVDDDPRFMMLETIREYGLETLEEQPFGPSVRRSHAQLMAALAEENELEDALLAADDGNFRTAIEWSCAAGDAELALRLGAALWWFWYLRGYYTEGRRSLDRILAVPGGEKVVVRAKALTGAGALAFLQCDYAKAIEFLEASIDLAREHGDAVSLASALQFRGSIARERGEYEHAMDLHLLARTIWEDLEDQANAGRSTNYVAFAAWLSGDCQRAFEMCEPVLALFREKHDTEGVAWSLLNLAAAAFYTGDLDRADAYLDESLTWSRTGGFKEGIAWSLNLLGLVLRKRGDPLRAERMLQDCLHLDWEMGDRWRIASVLESIGGLRRDARLMGAAAALRQRLGTPVPPIERELFDADLAALSEPPRWDRSLDEAIEIALA